MKKENKKIAIFTGTFNPFTIGHLNILEKAEAIFGKDNVIVSVGINPSKVPSEIIKVVSSYDAKSYNRVMENIRDTSINRIKAQIPSRTIEGYIGFLIDYVHNKELEGYDVTIVKGLRNSDDFTYEYTQMRYLLDQKPDMKMIFIACDPLYTHISSNACKQLDKIKQGSASEYLAREIKK